MITQNPDNDATLGFIVDIVSEGIWDWNAITGHVKRSPGWYRMLGYKLNDFDEDVFTWANLIHPEDYPRVMKHFESYISGDTNQYQIEYRCKKNDGTHLWIKDSGKVVEYTQDGKPARMIGAHININEEKIAREKLIEQNELLLAINASLENKVAEKTAEITEQERFLVVQSRLAAMGEMLSMIAHQWRQPLSTMTLLVAQEKFKLMMSESHLNQYGEILDKISNTMIYLSDTIDDFQTYFKPNKFTEKISVHALIERMKHFIEPRLKVVDVQMHIEQKTQDVIIETYTNEIIQVLINILNNSIDALMNIKNSERHIWLKVSSDDKTVSISVEDNGGGIDKDIMDKIFEPYFSTKSMNGTGLGLYMAKMIIDKHIGGSLDVENTKNGAHFTVLLPKKVLPS